ncbi:uncharacterized protein LOC111637035 [Centruroides sculpturatus]|uniref:uncharacterized protein LOC111637035 n=1 Tax=Centruroides sculpturatus TaxID=218467 RepID=UPI000C6C90D8|nr:uncharacterized protein LOC111637035 [Centruroides sculpturatus]
MEDKILSCIKQAKIHSLSTDIKEYLSHFSHEEQNLNSVQKAKFQNFVECLLQTCSIFLHKKQSDDNDVREIFISIQQCCQQKYCCFSNLLQVGRSFYHILINLLRLKRYNEAIYLSIYLKKVILQILQDGINNTETDIIVHQVYKNFWNHAIEVKHCQEVHDSLKHILSLRLRRVAFEFLCFKYSELNSICEQSSKAILLYITNSNGIINNKELTAFCTSIWNSLVTNRTFQQSISNEQKKTTIFSVLKMFKDWNKSLIKYIILKNLSVDILIWLDDIVELTKKIGDTDIMNIIQSGTDLTKCALNILLDQNNSEVYKDIAKDFMKSSNKLMNKDSLVSIIDSYVSVSCYYLLEIFNMFEREKKNFNSKQLFSLDSFLDCITNVCTSTKGLIQSENCSQLVILIVRLEGRLIKTIREEVQKSSDANFIKTLIQRGERIMQQFSIILDMKRDKYLYEDEYIGTEVGNLGIVLFGKDMHNNAIHCLEFSCEYLTQWIYSDSAPSEKKKLMQSGLISS